MKHYNPKFIREYIQCHASELETVSIGMEEDWSWTAETIFEDGVLSPRFDWDKDRIPVAGITGSTWATPVMAVLFVDGHEERVECWTDDYAIANPSFVAEQKTFARATGGMDRRF